MTNQKAKITKRSVDALPIPPKGENRLWDTDLTGFLVRVYPSGKKVYAVRYKRGAAQQSIVTIGRHGSPWTPEGAREKARQVLSQAREGRDPAAENRAARNRITVAGLIDTYLADGPTTKPAKRASSWVNDASNLNRHIRPLIGSRIADEVTKADAHRAIREITEGGTARDEKTGKRGRARVTGGPGVARRTRTTAAAMYAWAMEHELVQTNPFAAVRLAAPPMKARYLSGQETAALWEALERLEATGEMNPTFADAIRLLVLTGARKTEVLGLKWSEVDLGRRTLTLPPERTKAGGVNGERRIALSGEAATILARRHHTSDGEHVFPAARGDGHATGVRKAFKRACAAAGLSNVRVHDLRHTYASALAEAGFSMPIIAKSLGHSRTQTAERYTHLGDDPTQAAASVVADFVRKQAKVSAA